MVMRNPLAPDAVADLGHHILKRRLGTKSIVLMVVATAAPLGVMAGSAALAVGLGNSYGAAGTFVVVGVVMFLFSVALSAMAKYIRNSGAFYAYVGHGLGPATGMAAAALAWLTYAAVTVATFAYLGVQVDALVQSYGGPAVTWWVYTAIGLVVVGVLGYNDIELAAKVLGVALILEVIVVLIVDAAIAVQGGAEGLSLTAFAPSTVFGDLSTFSIAALFCAVSFLGFEATAVFRDEARDPDRTVPRATYIAIVFITAFYAVSTWLVSLAWPSSELQAVGSTGAPFLLGAAERFVGPAMSHIIQVLIITSILAVAISLHNILARYQFVFARSLVAPAVLGRLHPRANSPYVSSLVVSAVITSALVICVLLGLDPVVQILAWFSGVSAAGFFVLLLLTCLSTLVFFRRHKVDSRPWNTLVAPGLGVLALAWLLWITVSNFQYLVGGEPSLGYALLATLPAAAAIGIGLTLLFKATQPQRYAGILSLTQSSDDEPDGE
jgi:amino acid transporter